jgi:hypothetical protein
MKEIWENTKKNMWVWLFMLTFGFGLGKAFTYMSIATDCQVLGMFRIGMTAADCRISKVPS